MIVTFLPVPQGAQQFMAFEAEDEARENLQEFLIEYGFDGDTLEELITAAVRDGFDVGIDPSHDWVGLDG